MAAQAESAFKKRVQETAVLQDFSRELETRIFQKTTMCVMLAELCLVSFLAPTAALWPIPPITVPGSTPTIRGCIGDGPRLSSE